MRSRPLYGVLTLGSLVLASVTAPGCGDGMAVFVCPDDPGEIGYNDPGCVEGRCPTDPKDARYCFQACIDKRLEKEGKASPECADAGVNAAPGSEPQGACPACVPKPGGPQASDWTERPELVHFGDLGPKGELSVTCPDGTTEIDRLYNDLEGTTECDVCACEAPDGACTGMPASIDIRAGKCEEPGALSMSFDGPAGWDGSCTNEPALTEGAQCPAGSGTLCAQSISFTALPPPLEKPCAVKVEPIPKFNPPGVKWKKGSLACNAPPPAADSTCGEGNNQYCATAADTGFLHCIRLKGVHNECPLGYEADQYVMYKKTAILPGECTECTCGEPVGGACLGKFHVYADEACTNEIDSDPLSSLTGQCTNFPTPGPAVGSKEITDIERMPGVCAASGGEPIQDPKADPEGAITFCCRPLFHI